jgi:hypothetical protein
LEPDPAYTVATQRFLAEVHQIVVAPAQCTLRRNLAQNETAVLGRDLEEVSFADREPPAELDRDDDSPQLIDTTRGPDRHS